MERVTVRPIILTMQQPCDFALLVGPAKAGTTLIEVECLALIARGAIRSLLRRRSVRAIDCLDLVELRFQLALQATIDAVEVDVDHRRDEQRQQLR